MLDITTMVIAGAGGLSLTFAFIDYRFARKRKTEVEED
jgi:uncharacterized membrane protein SpoIIM required for sporulation